MYLTRLRLDPHHRDVQRCLADSQALHHFVLRLFDGSDATAGGRRAALGVLHRLQTRDEGATLELLIQSAAEPRAHMVPPETLAATDGSVMTTSLEPLLERLKLGAAFRFRLRANPTRKIDTKSGPDRSRRNGKRVPVRGDDGRTAWVRRQLERAGMRLAEDDDGNPWLRQRPDGLARGHRRGSAVLVHDSHMFEGVLSVVEPLTARAAVVAGIGPAKAYGFGLLSLAPL